MNKLSSPHGVWAGHMGTTTAGCMASWSQILTKLHECATACKSAYREQCAFANMSAMARTLNLDHRPRWQSSARRSQHAMPVDMARTIVRKCRTTAAIHNVKAGLQYYPQSAASRPTTGYPSLAPTSISRGPSCCDRPHWPSPLPSYAQLLATAQRAPHCRGKKHFAPLLSEYNTTLLFRSFSAKVHMANMMAIIS